MRTTASDAAVAAVRFEAREWRAAFVGTDFNDQPKQYPAEWAIYATDSGVRLAYAKSEDGAKDTAVRWNKGQYPSAIGDKADAAHDLRELLKPGDTVSTILRHCSRSGMSRRISLVISTADGIRDISWLAAKVMDEPIKSRAGYVQDAGIVVGGCGMDMGFHLVHNLSSVLFPDGFDCVGKGCPSNDHCNRVKADHHESGGYALRQRWL
jgi:hypothetical protein